MYNSPCVAELISVSRHASPATAVFFGAVPVIRSVLLLRVLYQSDLLFCCALQSLMSQDCQILTPTMMGTNLDWERFHLTNARPTAYSHGNSLHACLGLMNVDHRGVKILNTDTICVKLSPHGQSYHKLQTHNQPNNNT